MPRQKTILLTRRGYAWPRHLRNRTGLFLVDHRRLPGMVPVRLTARVPAAAPRQRR